MSYGIQTINVHKKLKLDKRQGSENWYARLTLDNGKRIVRSTKTDNLEEAQERAIELYYETQSQPSSWLDNGRNNKPPPDAR